MGNIAHGRRRQRFIRGSIRLSDSPLRLLRRCRTRLCGITATACHIDNRGRQPRSEMAEFDQTSWQRPNLLVFSLGCQNPVAPKLPANQDAGCQAWSETTNIPMGWSAHGGSARIKLTLVFSLTLMRDAASQAPRYSIGLTTPADPLMLRQVPPAACRRSGHL